MRVCSPKNPGTVRFKGFRALGFYGVGFRDLGWGFRGIYFRWTPHARILTIRDNRPSSTSMTSLLQGGGSSKPRQCIRRPQCTNKNSLCHPKPITHDLRSPHPPSLVMHILTNIHKKLQMHSPKPLTHKLLHRLLLYLDPGGLQGLGSRVSQGVLP